jgi:hydroxyquinol 1,2-dioxygenase
MRDFDHETITKAVIDRFADTPDQRLKEIISSFVRHLHCFAREIRLTEDEWTKGIAFLTATGQKCDDKRQEFILLSDVLGLSTLIVAMNHEKPAQCTEATVFGPFYVESAPYYRNGEDVANGASGEQCVVSGTVRDIDGSPIAGATVDVWQADSDGMYDVQYSELNRPQCRGVLCSDDNGAFHFHTVLPEAYPIPTDGPVGALLQATHRHPWRPAHLHFRIEIPGYETLVTHVFREEDPWLDSDAVFGVRQTLIAPWVRRDDGSYLLRFDFVLNRKGASSK